MADFCFQCSLMLMFGPHSDFDHFGKDGQITAEEVENGLGMLVLCEGCGPTRVDHLGRCLGGCDARWCRDADGSLPEVPRKAEEWLARRAGRLGWLLRAWDWWAGTPWEPGYWHHLRWRWYDWRAGDSFEAISDLGGPDVFDFDAATQGTGTRKEVNRAAEGEEAGKDGADPAGVPRRKAN